jgi:AcrR family transcriptional regulator
MKKQSPTLQSAGVPAANRPRRGNPQETRRRLVLAAGVVFNRDGYAGTDSNKIAREAGYSPGTFYKHFADKKEAFMAAYAEWVAEEWREVERILTRNLSAPALANELVNVILDLHKRWRGLRRSLRALVTEDEDVRRAYTEARCRQLDTMAKLSKHERREQDAILLYTLERSADAVADGELPLLGLREEQIRALLEDQICSLVSARKLRLWFRIRYPIRYEFY